MKNEILEWINSIIENLSTDASSEQAKALLKQYKHIRYVAQNSVFDLVPDNLKKNLRSRMSSAASNVQNYSNLKSYADSTITEFSLPINARRSKQESSEIIEEIRMQSDLAIQSLEERKGLLDSEIATLKSQNASLETEISSLKQRSDKEATRLDSLVANEQERFSDKKASLEQSYSDKISDLDEKVEIFRKEKELEFSSMVTAAKTNTDKIDQLYNLASKTSVSGFFAKRASDEKGDADLFRILAAVFYVLIPLTLVGLYWFDDNKSLSLDVIGRKIAVALTFLLPAIYFSRESQKHRQHQFEAQKTGIRTQGFEPFIEKLSDSDASELRKKMVVEWFTDKDKEKEKKEPIVGYSMSKITKLIEAISKLNPTGS